MALPGSKGWRGEGWCVAGGFAPHGVKHGERIWEETCLSSEKSLIFCGNDAFCCTLASCFISLQDVQYNIKFILPNIGSWVCYMSVRIGSHSSPPNPCSVGVPQNSVLGPLLFSIYISPISAIANSHQVSQQQYADDTQCCSFASQLQPKHSALESCLNSLRVWFCENGMALNPT